MPAAIHTAGLTRTFRTKNGTVEAVRGIDLTVPQGEIIGFLGPNGAGKTTTLRMLTTLLTPTAGKATVAGRDLITDPRSIVMSPKNRWRVRPPGRDRSGAHVPFCGRRRRAGTVPVVLSWVRQYAGRSRTG